MSWTFRGKPPSGGYPHTPTAIIFLVSIIVLEILTISLLLKSTLPLSVYIVKVYDVGDVGYWDVVCLNVTNHGNSPVYPIFLLYMLGSEKRWVVSSQIMAYAPYNCPLTVIPPHSSRLINISAPSPLYFIPPFTRIFVQVYSGYNFVNSPVYVTPVSYTHLTLPTILRV